MAGRGSTRAAVSLLVTAALACHSSPTTPIPDPKPLTATCGTAMAPVRIHHVIWIWMENHDDTDVIGASAAPYINRLAALCGLATNYNGVTHPSLPNYIAGVSGSTQDITDNNPPASHPLNVGNLFEQVKSAGLQWREYMESAPGNCPSDSSGLYAVRHDPAPYFTNIAADCKNWSVPMGTTTGGAFLTDVQAGTLPAFSFVSPNVCNDTHDCSIETGDVWLSSWLPIILGGPDYKAGHTAIFIVWDEGRLGNRVPAIVVSPYTRAGKSSSTRFDHYSLLRTTEELLGIGTRLLGAATAPSMLADLFGS